MADIKFIQNSINLFNHKHIHLAKNVIINCKAKLCDIVGWYRPEVMNFTGDR
jgi:hypothetical protein